MGTADPHWSKPKVTFWNGTERHLWKQCFVLTSFDLVFAWWSNFFSFSLTAPCCSHKELCQARHCCYKLKKCRAATRRVGDRNSSGIGKLAADPELGFDVQELVIGIDEGLSSAARVAPSRGWGVILLIASCEVSMKLVDALQVEGDVLAVFQCHGMC